MRDDNLYEEIMNSEIKSQAKKDPHIDWGTGLSILLFSDNAAGRSEALNHYLSSNTDLSSVELVSEYGEARETILKSAPDAIVFVGSLISADGYKLVADIKQTQANTFICMYAHLDAVVKNICGRYSIKDMFPDNLPVSEFVKFLQAMIKRVKTK